MIRPPAYACDWSSVYVTDALEGAKFLEPQSVHCIVTSPPYWALRSYLPTDDPSKPLELGGEPTPEAYVEKLVEVFRVLRDVLRDDGTLWINLGSSYAGSWGNQGRKTERGTQRPINSPMMQNLKPYPKQESNTGSWANNHPQFKPKDLVPIPWMVGLALQKDGWWLRADNIWHKPNPMPSSVTDRPTISHEYMLMFSKKPRYYFDQEAVREPHWHQRPENQEKYRAQIEQEKRRRENQTEPLRGNGQTAAVKHSGDYQDNRLAEFPSGRNIRSVWTIATRPYPGSHYATFPADLIYPCIKAGTSEKGVCAECGNPWVRVVETERGGPSSVADRRAMGGFRMREGRSTNGEEPSGRSPGSDTRGYPTVINRTVGFQPSCSHEAEVVPATVLDPFMGSGTTAYAARKLGRRSVGFDLDERNIELVAQRMAKAEEEIRYPAPLGKPKPEPQSAGNLQQSLDLFGEETA